MDNTSSNILVPLFFIHATLGVAILAWWFLSKKQLILKNFGWGLLGYTLGLAAWTILVITKPTDMKPLILIGVVPFLSAHIAYAKAASEKLAIKASTLMGLVVALIVVIFVYRTFLYPSEPYFSDKGYLYFGLAPAVVALYIAIFSVSFLPAIRSVSAVIKDQSVKSVMAIGFTTLYINSIILVSSKDNTLQLINGVVMSLALLTLWAKVLGSRAKA